MVSMKVMVGRMDRYNASSAMSSHSKTLWYPKGSNDFFGSRVVDENWSGIGSVRWPCQVGNDKQSRPATGTRIEGDETR